MVGVLIFFTPPMFSSSPLKSYKNNPIGGHNLSSNFPSPGFFSGASLLNFGGVCIFYVPFGYLLVDFNFRFLAFFCLQALGLPI